MPEITDPSPPMLPNPPVKALAIPPYAVCLSKVVHSLPDPEDGLELDSEGLPN
jgi:hypothetical protein